METDWRHLETEQKQKVKQRHQTMFVWALVCYLHTHIVSQKSTAGAAGWAGRGHLDGCAVVYCLCTC